MITDQSLDTPADPVASGRRQHRIRPGRAWVLVAVSLGTFMTYLDNNIINVAIPTIQRDLHLSESGIEWVVSSFILLFAGLLLAGGRLADVFGRKRLFMVGLTVFTVASLAAGMSGQIDLLVASRALQGIGAALLTPTTLAIITATYPKPGERAAAVGAWSAVGALALAVGPLLGGLLSEDANWHWIFFINVPFGIITLAVAAWAIPQLDVATRRSFDVPGVVSSALALISLTYGLIQGPQAGWGDPAVLAAFALSLVAAVAFVMIERRASDPMIDLSLFTNRVFAGGTAALMMWAFGLFGIYFFTSLYLQDVLGFSAIKAGTAFVPMAVLMAAGATISDRVAARIGAYRTVAIAMGVMATGMASVSLLGAHATFADLMPGFALVGVGGGLAITLTSTILDVMPVDRAGVASGIFNASREMAGLLGITVIGVVVTARQSADAHTGHQQIQAFLSGYRLGLLLAAVLVATGGVAAWVALRLVPPLATVAVEAPIASSL